MLEDEVTFVELRSDVVILACAISAGIHGALTPSHFEERAAAGIGFVGATVLLAALAVWLTRRPTAALPLAGAAAALTGLLASYALAATTGLPLLHPDAASVDGLGLATKAIEAVGLLAAATLLWRPRAVVINPRLKGTLT
jgi:hypothetical protein